MITAETICHICNIRLGDEGSSICSAAHGERFWNNQFVTAMAKAVAEWERQTSHEYSTDGLEAACWAFHEHMKLVESNKATT